MKRKNSILLAGIAAVGIFCLTIVAVLETYYERWQAEAAIKTISSVEVGGTDGDSAAQSMRQRFHDHLFHHSATFDQYRFRNLGFALLHLAPRTYIWMEIDYKDGVVTRKFFQYYEEPRCTGELTEQLAELPSKKDRSVYLGSDTPSPVFAMRVYDNLNVPRERRGVDWQIDLSCFTRFRGCQDPRRVLYGALSEVARK
jgi:hypothetical protein